MFENLFRGLADVGGTQRMSRRDHYLRDTRYLKREPFGRGVNRRRTILVVPELRKRRSERDPAELARQIAAARERWCGERGPQR